MKLQKGEAIKGFAENQKKYAWVAVCAVFVIILVLFATGKSAEVPVAEQTEAETTQTAEETTEPEPKVDEDGNIIVDSNTDKYELDDTIIVQGDRAMEIYSVSTKYLSYYGQIINRFAEDMPGTNVYCLLAPTSVEFYGPDDYRTENHSQVKAMECAYSQFTAKNLKSVDARNAIAEHTDEYIYLRTDHHWTARGAYYAYRAFCETAGLKATSLKSHETGKIEGFVGSMYRYTQAEVLKNNPDYVEYFLPNHDVEGRCYQTADVSGEGSHVSAVYTGVDPENAYLCFLGGDNPVDKFTTSVGNGKSIVVIKESYGNAFAPFLMDNYETVYVIDPRKVTLDLRTFVKNNNIDDVLFLNYCMAPSNPTYRSAFYTMLGEAEL